MSVSFSGLVSRNPLNYVGMTFDYTIIIPARNESATLLPAMERLASFCESQPEVIEVILVENGSTDATWLQTQILTSTYVFIKAHQSDPGKGSAILEGWRHASSPVVLFLDADLSPSLETLPHLYQEVKRTGGCAVADRFLKTSRVERSFKRECISRMWAFLVSHLLPLPFMDYQCGAKAFPCVFLESIRQETTGRDWGFDLELLLWFQKHGLSISRVPTVWTERGFSERKSSLPIIRTSFQFLRRLFQLRREIRSHRS